MCSSDLKTKEEYCHQCQRGRLLEMFSLMAKEMEKEEHLKQQQGKESMRHEAKAVLEGSVDWRSGEAAEELQEQEAALVKEKRIAKKHKTIQGVEWVSLSVQHCMGMVRLCNSKYKWLLCEIMINFVHGFTVEYSV